MGCCVSTNQDSTSTFQKHQNSLKDRPLDHESRAPPPTIEEETVKEVLSETPKPKPPLLPQPEPIKNPPQNQENKKIHIEKQPFLGDKITENVYSEKSFQEEEIFEQEVSEVCSFSMSETVSTTTIYNDRRDDDGDEDEDEDEVKQRAIRSPAPKFPSRNRAWPGDSGRAVGKSPTRRPEQSPRKRSSIGGGVVGGAVKLVQSRELDGNYQMVVGRRGLRSDTNKRDTDRRSRSPATTRSRMGRSPSGRRTNRSPGRIRTKPDGTGDGRGNSNESGMEGKWSTTTNGGGATTNESLENPLVSLECFIFL